MSYNTFSPPINPQSVDDTVSIKYNANSFGDGYEQNVILGLNNEVIERTLNWPCLTSAQYNSILTFLQTNKGKSFYYTVDNVTKLYKCWSWSISRTAKIINLKATFKEVFI